LKTPDHFIARSELFPRDLISFPRDRIFFPRDRIAIPSDGRFGKTIAHLLKIPLTQSYIFKNAKGPLMTRIMTLLAGDLKCPVRARASIQGLLYMKNIIVIQKCLIPGYFSIYRNLLE
jgi:hypothetical protein